MKTFTNETPGVLHADAFHVEARGNGAHLAPLLAGARARGVADGLEWLGLAAVLLDDRGEVLHVNARAIELMGEDLFLAGGRLRARDGLADLELGAAIRGVLSYGEPTAMEIPMAGQGALSAKIAAMDSQDDDPFQLLRAVAILERRGDNGRAWDGHRH